MSSTTHTPPSSEVGENPFDPEPLTSDEFSSSDDDEHVGLLPSKLKAEMERAKSARAANSSKMLVRHVQRFDEEPISAEDAAKILQSEWSDAYPGMERLYAQSKREADESSYFLRYGVRPAPGQDLSCPPEQLQGKDVADVGRSTISPRPPTPPPLEVCKGATHSSDGEVPDFEKLFGKFPSDPLVDLNDPDGPPTPPNGPGPSGGGPPPPQVEPTLLLGLLLRVVAHLVGGPFFHLSRELALSGPREHATVTFLRLSRTLSVSS